MKTPTSCRLKLATLTLDPELYTRAGIDPDLVGKYAALVRSGEKFKDNPALVVHDPKALVWWLVDGWHRYYAHVKGGKREMYVRIVRGTYHKAVELAIGANVTHGQGRTIEDEQYVVRQALANEIISRMPDSDVADLCGVPAQMVTMARSSQKTT